MAGALAVMGVLVLSDVADARAPRKAVPQKVARVEQSQTVTAQESSPESVLDPAPEAEAKPVTRKRTKKAQQVDFGRFEGY